MIADLPRINLHNYLDAVCTMTNLNV